MDYKIIVLLSLIGGLLGFLYVDLGILTNTYIKNPIGLFIFLGLFVGFFIGLVYNYIISFLK